jgi:hypothetical protein
MRIILLLLLSTIASAQVRVCLEPGIVNVSMPNSEGYDLIWNPSTGYVNDENQWVILDTGFHDIKVEVIDPETGCSAFRSKRIHAICDTCSFFVPNAFTPNLDTNNNVFIPVGLNMDIEQLNIFNRWGELIYSGLGPWDGQNSQNDVYVWACDYFCAGNRMKATGRVTIVR